MPAPKGNRYAAGKASGRRPAYKPEYVEQARKLCLLGATDYELADFFGIDTRTIGEWRGEHAEFAEQSKAIPDWQEKRADRTRARNAERNAKITARRKIDPAFRVRSNMKNRLHALIVNRESGRIFSLLPYSARDVVEHMEANFLPGMSWENYGKWHIDHRKPCALFDHSDPAQVEACWALENLQPLWAVDNLKKGAMYVGS